MLCNDKMLDVLDELALLEWHLSNGIWANCLSLYGLVPPLSPFPTPVASHPHFCTVTPFFITSYNCCLSHHFRPIFLLHGTYFYNFSGYDVCDDIFQCFSSFFSFIPHIKRLLNPSQMVMKETPRKSPRDPPSSATRV